MSDAAPARATQPAVKTPGTGPTTLWRVAARGLAIAGLICVSACGGPDAAAPLAAPAPPAPATPDRTTVPAEEVAFLDAYMRDWYLWREQVPAADLSAFATAEAALAVLAAPQDRFSYIESTPAFNEFFEAGTTVGFGVGYGVRGDTVWLRLIQPLSPAAAAGLHRGDQIVAIDGVSTEALIATGRLDSAFGPIAVGVKARFTVQRDGARFEVPVIKQTYRIASVLATRVVQADHRRVGYVGLYTFTAPTLTDWHSALNALAAEGAQDIVVDLRENGGGLLSVATEVASTLAPPDAPGKTFLRAEYNAAHRESDNDYAFLALPGVQRFERLVWLTSGRTCSAAEALIVGLRPYRNALTIGSGTCGKPVGFNPEQRGDKVYSIVTFKLVGSTGETDYFGGLTPNCPADDDFSKAFGDPQEPVLAAALAVLAGKPCPGAAIAKARSPGSVRPRLDFQHQLGLK